MTINKIDLTNLQQTLSGVLNTRGFQLTSLADDTAMTIEAGGVEEIGDYIYRATSQTAATDVTAASGGRYVYVSDDGTGVGSFFVSTQAPTYNAKGGFYHSFAGGLAKCVFYTYKNSGTYTLKTRYDYIQGDRFNGDFTVNGDLNVSGIIRTDTISELTTGAGVTIDNNAYVYNNASGASAAVIAAAMAADGFESGGYYAATGVYNNSSAYFSLCEIAQTGGTTLAGSGVRIDSVAIFNRASLTIHTATAITVFKVRSQ